MMRLFNKIKLQTPESVELEFTLAGIGNRAYALAIDYILLGITILFTLLITLFLSYQLVPYFIDGELQKSLLKWLWAIEFFIIFIIYVGYFVIWETLWRGQTPGKKWVKIRVIRDDGKPVRIAQATIRALLRPVDDILFIGVFFIAFTNKEKRIGDLVAGTVVIQNEPSQKAINLALSSEAKDLAIQLRIETKINNLLPEDYTTIRDYLQKRKMMTLEAQHHLSRKLAQQIQQIIQLETIPENYSNSQFIEATYWAYQQEFEQNKQS